MNIKSENSSWVSSSALSGIKSLEITLSQEPTISETTYTVNLYFAELEDKKPGERIFDIAIQDKKVTDKLDIVAEAGKCDSEVVKTFRGIRAEKIMKIDLIPVRGNTIISGIEIIQEKLAEK